jgi:hypothetical protein
MDFLNLIFDDSISHTYLGMIVMLVRLISVIVLLTHFV